VSFHRNPGTDFLHSPGGVEVTIGAVVKKQFRQSDAITHVRHLKNIYNLLKTKKVPNTDELIKAVATKESYILTKPVGIDCPPRTGAELFQAAICVLQALTVSPIFASCTCF
jgi:hypothetical protein